MSLTVSTTSQEETTRLGAAIGRRLTPGDVVLLHGDLGSGKTTLAQGILAGCGLEGPVPSPTFTLVNEYVVEPASGEPMRLYHVDLYRLAGDSDLDSIGFDDYLAPVGGLSLIEWPERAASRLDGDYLLIEIVPTGDQWRQLRLSKAPAGSARFEWLETFPYGQ
jgi:tRNA threonylcarbamoyladenosine biosynthesis protein TsaE